MLIEIYDYAAKLLNNMTATTTSIINNLATTTATNLTSQFVQTTSNKMKRLLNETINTIVSTTTTTSSSTAQTQSKEHAAPYTLSTLLRHSNNLTMPQLNHSSSNSIITTTTTNTTNLNVNLSLTTDNNNMYNAFSSAIPDAGSSSTTSNISGFIESSTTAASTALSQAAAAAITRLPSTSSTASTVSHIGVDAQTVATFIAAGNKNRATTIVVYPTVSPESIVIPIVSCIFGFPILALIVICCLRRRAKLARERDRRRNYDMQDHAVSLVRFSPIHRLNYRSSRAISLRPERSLSQGFTSLELDTVLEERCSDVEQTQTEILNPESPMDTNSYKMSFSSS